MAWRPFVHIKDIAQAYVRLLTAPADVVRGQAFNVGNTNENYRIKELATAVKDGVPGSKLVTAEDPIIDHRNYRVRCDKLKDLVPSYQTLWTAKRGVDEVYQAILGTGLKAEAFEGEQYNRIAHVRSMIKKGLIGTDLRWKEQVGENIEAAE